MQRGLARRPDLGRLREYEAELGDPTLWGPIIGDRRISLGRLCTLRQDYTPRFSHEQMLGIIEEGLVTLERLFDELQPDAVFSFVCVTFAEYLAYLFARARGIRYLSLRSTRVENFVTFAPTVFEPSEPLIARVPPAISARHGGRVELGRAALPGRRARRRAALRRRRAGLAPGDAGPAGQRAAARAAGRVRAGRIRLLVPRRTGRQPGAGSRRHPLVLASPEPDARAGRQPRPGRRVRRRAGSPAARLRVLPHAHRAGDEPVGAEPLLPESDRRDQEHRAVAAGRVPGPDQGAPGVDGQASAQLLPQAPRRAQPAHRGSGPELARDRGALPHGDHDLRVDRVRGRDPSQAGHLLRPRLGTRSCRRRWSAG